MITELSVLGTVNDLLVHEEKNDPNFNVLGAICNDLRDAHMSLGICVASEFYDLDCEERVRKVMDTIASTFSALNEVVEEERRYQYELLKKAVE